MGIEKGDRCALLSENRWEWAIRMSESDKGSPPLFTRTNAALKEHSSSNLCGAANGVKATV